MEIATVIPAVVGIIAVVILTAMRSSRSDSRRRLLHEERMSAIEKGVPIPEDTEVEPERPRRGRESALQGTILTALGLGMLAAGRLAPRAELRSDLREVLAFLEVWAYPATFVGVGLLVYALFTRERKR